jgi:hypothetical protein
METVPERQGAALTQWKNETNRSPERAKENSPGQAA